MAKEPEELTLERLAGEHMLSGVDRLASHPMRNYYGGTYAGEVLRFTLDGVTYMACEDDNDGYRSAMEHLLISDSPPVNQFQPVAVIAEYHGEFLQWSDELIQEIDCHSVYVPSGQADLLILRKTDTGKIVLAVGTGATDDYYPGFVAYFDATALGEVDVTTSQQETA